MSVIIKKMTLIEKKTTATIKISSIVKITNNNDTIIIKTITKRLTITKLL